MVGGDANTCIGSRVDGTVALEEVVGPFQHGIQSAAGDIMLNSTEAMGFMAPASFVKGGGPPHCGLRSKTIGWESKSVLEARWSDADGTVPTGG